MQDKKDRFKDASIEEDRWKWDDREAGRKRNRNVVQEGKQNSKETEKSRFMQTGDTAGEFSEWFRYLPQAPTRRGWLQSKRTTKYYYRNI